MKSKLRKPRIRFSIRQMMIAVAIVGVGSWAFAQYQRLGFYYLSGWWEAECELWRGEPTIYGGCGGILSDICCVDHETGLPICPVLGCVVQRGESERVAGHNDRVAQYIRWYGLPTNSLKRWEAELFHLKRFFERRSRLDLPQRLRANGPEFVSPDGQNSVRPVGRVKGVGQRDYLKVVIAAGGVVLDDCYAQFDGDESDLLWGPEGSRFSVIRSVSGTTECYEAYDLRTGRLLRVETWYDGKTRDDLLRPDVELNPEDTQRMSQLDSDL